MFQLLPGEIIDEIIAYLLLPQHINVVESLTQSYEDQTLRSLATLCRVSRAFYAHVGRLLYGTVTIDDLNSPLLDSLETVNPDWVRSLIILENRPRPLIGHELSPYTAKELERWEKLENVVERMESLESLIYKVDHHSPRLSAAISRRPFLRHLTAENTVPFTPGPPPVQSLAIYWLPHRSRELDSLQSLVARSAKELRKLHLSLHFVDEPEIPEILATVFTEPYQLPLLELALDLPSFTPEIVKTLTSAIDVSGLVRLDLQGSKNAACLTSALTGQAKKIRWLRLEGPVAPFIASFSGLEYLSWTHMVDETLDVDLLVQHGASLKNLFLSTRYILSAADVQKLTAACQKLEVLYINVDYTELQSIAKSLATLKSLQELRIAPRMDDNVLTLPNGPFYVRPVSFRDKSRYLEASNYLPFLPYLVDGIDAALGLLLVSGVTCADIGIGGLVPPYEGIFDHIFEWGLAVPRFKRWVKNGRAGDDEIIMINYRGGNVGDRYRCEGVEGEWELMDPYHGLVNREPTPLGKDRVPYCCVRKLGRCKPRPLTR